ncbi:MAG: adenylate/guanylate cyclase domain-containing protein [Chloroflexaceae bacterium]|nr:adenylate/guanylate cyclase domain-containing protein [Chloroflexaceae bacterium]
MDTRLQTIASYVPSMIVRKLMASTAPPDAPVEDGFPAALLFADFSGFTELTEHLSHTHHGPDSAEELSNVLNRAFDEVITPILALGGDVVTFAGDALLALWPAKDEHLATMVRRAAQCALVLQMLFREERLASQVRLGVRMGIGVGEVVLSCVGGVYERWLWLVRGPSVSQVMQAEQQAHPGQVVLAPEAWELVRAVCTGRPVEATAEATTAAPGEDARAPGTAGGILLEEVCQPVPFVLPSPLVAGPALEEAMRAFVPDVVLMRLAAGQGGWLAELRLVTVLFINLPDISEATAVRTASHAPAPAPSLTLDQVQQSICALQTALYRYEGSVNKISVDEKGTILIGVFGLPPLAHEDDAARGVQAALVARSELQALGMRCAIGVTTGQAFCGVIGSDQRREYTILGDVVNLAARLMQQAASDDDAILCDGATCSAAQPRLVFEALSPVVVKGRSDPVEVYRPLRQEPHMMRAQEVLIGRVRERTLLMARLQAMRRGGANWWNRREPSVLLIEGEAGIGKSRLLDDVRHQAETLGIEVLTGAGEAIEQTTPYYPWRQVFTQVLGLEATSEPSRQRQHVLETLASEPAMLRQASLLNAVLPLELPEMNGSLSRPGRPWPMPPGLSCSRCCRCALPGARPCSSWIVPTGLIHLRGRCSWTSATRCRRCCWSLLCARQMGHPQRATTR